MNAMRTLTGSINNERLVGSAWTATGNLTS